jgi:hypothetical protein
MKPSCKRRNCDYIDNINATTTNFFISNLEQKHFLIGWVGVRDEKFFKCAIPNLRFVTLVCTLSSIVLFEFSSHET